MHYTSSYLNVTMAPLPSYFGWVIAATKEEWLKPEGDREDVKKTCKEKTMFRNVMLQDTCSFGTTLWLHIEDK